MTVTTRTKLLAASNLERLEAETNAFLQTLEAPPISVTFHVRPESRSGAEDYVVMILYFSNSLQID